jgi:hypothetical protein
MQIRIRESGSVIFWHEFRTLLLEQNPSELITVAEQTEEWLDAKGADVVLEGPQASGGTVYQYSQRDGVEQLDGKWYTKYVLGPIFTDTTFEGVSTTALEHETAYKAMKDSEQAKSVRQTRDDKLSVCDWTQLNDAPVDKAAWATHRQALRDIPEQAGFPWAIEWPVAT